MNNNHIMVYDLETGSRNPYKTQITQIAAVMIEPRKLEIVPNSEFNSEVKPELDDEKAKELGLDPVEDAALKKTRKTREKLAEAPDLSSVLPAFADYAKKYTVKKTEWGYPIRAGYNIIMFDNIIIDNAYEKFKLSSTFHPNLQIDVMHNIFQVTENVKINSANSISFDNIREWLGMSTVGSHDGIVDVYDCAEILIRFLRLNRKMHSGLKCTGCGKLNKVQFEGALNGWERKHVL